MSLIVRRVVVFESLLSPHRLFAHNSTLLEKLIVALKVYVHVEIKWVAWFQEILDVLFRNDPRSHLEGGIPTHGRYRVGRATSFEEHLDDILDQNEHHHHPTHITPRVTSWVLGLLPVWCSYWGLI